MMSKVSKNKAFLFLYYIVWRNSSLLKYLFLFTRMLLQLPHQWQSSISWRYLLILQTWACDYVLCLSWFRCRIILLMLVRFLLPSLCGRILALLSLTVRPRETPVSLVRRLYWKLRTETWYESHSGITRLLEIAQCLDIIFFLYNKTDL